jgi:hypothetical protein
MERQRKPKRRCAFKVTHIVRQEAQQAGISAPIVLLLRGHIVMREAAQNEIDGTPSLYRAAVCGPFSLSGDALSTRLFHRGRSVSWRRYVGRKRSYFNATLFFVEESE